MSDILDCCGCCLLCCACFSICSRVCIYMPWGKHKTPDDLEDEVYAAEVERQMQMEGDHQQQTFTQPQLASPNPYDKVEKGHVVDNYNHQNTGT